MRSATRIVSAGLVLALFACGRDAEPPPAAEAAEAAHEPAAAPAEVLYVDVRTPEEFAEGHVAGAVNIPHDRMAARWGEIAAHRDRPVVLYCRTGRRSEMALDVLRERGFSDLRNGVSLDRLAGQGVPTAR